MKQLTQLIIICFIALLISSFKEYNDNNKDELTISAQFVNLENSSVEAVLWNNTKDTIAYLSGTCSWQDSYKTDNHDLFIQMNMCYKNGKQIIKIPPHKSVKKTLELVNTNKIHGIKFRIGFNYVKPTKDHEIISIKEEVERNANMIWSNSLFL